MLILSLLIVSLRIVLVVMMRSKELKTSRFVPMLILSIRLSLLSVCVSLDVRVYRHPNEHVDEYSYFQAVVRSLSVSHCFSKLLFQPALLLYVAGLVEFTSLAS